MTLSLGQHCPEAKLIKVFKEEEDVEKPPFLRQWGGRVNRHDGHEYLGPEIRTLSHETV